MGLNQTINLLGDKQVKKALSQLNKQVAKKVMRPAINAGLNPILREARQLAKANFKSDTISRMIKKKVAKNLLGKVYVQSDKERTVTVEGREVPFNVVANILEFGRKDGSLRPRSYMRRARESKSTEALREVGKKAKQRLDLLTTKGGLKFK